MNLILGLRTAQAAEFTDSGVIFESMDDANVISTSVGDRVIVYLMPTTAATEASIRVTFPTGFTVNATAGNWTTSTSNLPTNINGAAVNAVPGLGATAGNVSGQNVAFPSSNLTVGTLYAFAITGGLTMPDVSANTEYTNGQVATRDATVTNIDVSEWATQIFNGTAGDDIAVSATVDANFEYTLDTTAVALGTLSDASVTS
ncbi:hypothetical protein HY524_02215, partial [Candidatus Berkelbacteria bacterium]|nr:hypothetical protein [Candidatus Berkelbacteria bacterium]